MIKFSVCPVFLFFDERLNFLFVLREKCVALVHVPSHPSFSRWHFHLPLPSHFQSFLKRPLRVDVTAFHRVAEGYALLSYLYSAHACIFILLRVSVHYRHKDISLQLRTRGKEGQGKHNFHEASIVALRGFYKEMDKGNSHISKCVNKILTTLIHIRWPPQHCHLNNFIHNIVRFVKWSYGTNPFFCVFVVL